MMAIAFCLAQAQPTLEPTLVDAPTNTTEEPEEDECALSWDEKKYNLKLHIGSVFIVLGTSALGILGAVFISTNKWLRKKQAVLFCIQATKFFGIGVILATAWIHLLPPAIDAFSSDCLLKHGKWGRYGVAYVGLFGMIAAFFVQGLEFCALSRGDAKAKALAKKAKQQTKDAEAAEHTEPTDDKAALKVEESDECNVHHTHSHDHEEKPHKPKKKHTVSLHDVTGHSHDVVSGVIDDHAHGHGSHDDSDFATFFLELGILFHSVIIGLALGTATDEFKSLLIAIIFHQLFEGIALGVRIAEVSRFSNWKKYAAAFLYPIATPIGIAVGIGIRKSFNANAYRSILSQGILDSLSAGILFYNGYVELMAFEMNRNAVFRAHNGVRKAALFFAVYVGAATMAVIGLWA